MYKMPTREEANYFREIMNGNKVLTEVDEKYLEEWYLINHDKNDHVDKSTLRLIFQT